MHFGGGACQRIRLKVASIHTRTHTHTITHIHWQRFGIVLGYQFLVQKRFKNRVCFERDMGRQAPEAARPCSESTGYCIWRATNLILQSQSNWSLFNGTWQKRHRELENRLSCEIGEMTLRMQ